jgi:rfaE bifunctional protein nucleotidyltransferase chain/domain
MTIVYTGGVYDILHKGHLRLLKRAKSLGDFLVVGIEEDSSVIKMKPRPILSTQERVEQMQELPFVDRVVTYSVDENTKILESIVPDIFVHGDDWEAQTDRTEMLDYMKENRIKVVYLPRTMNISDTEIKNRIYETKPS